jgi:hypothetical protein
MTTRARHVIFGTGAIGLSLLDALHRRGETARLVNRSGSAVVPDEIEVIGGDARDPAFTTEVARGAQVVYQTLNPPYAEWTAQFPPLQAAVLAAAEATGARMVSMENVYIYGRPAGRPLTEDRAYDAHTKKGQLRGRMARQLLAAHDAGRVEVAIGRASDYFGPRGGAQSNLGDRLFPAALAGKTASVLGGPDQPHTLADRPFVFAPKGFLVAILPGADEAERAAAALRTAGFADQKLRIFTGEQILADCGRYIAQMSLPRRVAAAVTDDQETLDLYHGHAHDGRAALWVHVADDEATRAIRGLSGCRTLHIRHYGHHRQGAFILQRPTP